MSVHPLIKSLKASLIVSVQAYPGEPLRTPETMAQMSRACELGGAQRLSAVRGFPILLPSKAVSRCQSSACGRTGMRVSISRRRCAMPAPASPQVLISWPSTRPTAIVPTVSCSRIRCAHFRKRGVLLMADCMTIEDIRHAYELGFDLVSTTLSHNKPAIETSLNEGPDLPLLRQAVEEFPDLPIICEGHVHTPQDARAALDAGAWSVVVGTAITHPTSVTSWFKAALDE